MLRACSGLALALALFSFSARADQYPDHAAATRTVVIVRVVWVANHAEANAICNKLAGTAPDPKSTTLACYHPATSTIYTVQPSSFNDLYNLMILGHEFWHALGAEHPDT